MTVRLRVATANVQSSLSRRRAREALDVVLAAEPDVLALQEWYAVRRGLLPRAGWTWRAPVLGGCVVGIREDRLQVVEGGTHWLSRPGRADRDEGWWGMEPARAAAVLRCRVDDRELGLVSHHLVSGVQRHGERRPDRPRLVARHDHEQDRLQGLVDELRRSGAVVTAGDSNWHGFALDGLRSLWTDRPGLGTLGRRQVDDVLSTGTPLGVRLLETGSDHRAVVADLAF